MKTLLYFALFLITGLLVSCDDEDKLAPSGEDLFPPREMNALDTALAEIYAPYNTVVEYRYIKNFLPNDWYYIAPPREENVLPMAKLLKEMWVSPLEAGSSHEFIQVHFPKMIILVGSPSYNRDGTETLGEAEGGTIIRFTRVDDFDLGDLSWLQQQIHTAFHEYAHILHQTFGMPDAYRNVTPDNYTKNGWQTVIGSGGEHSLASLQNAMKRGMVSPYGTSAISEDFAELFAFYVMAPDEWVSYILTKENKPETVELDKGREWIALKFSTLTKFLLSNGIDIDLIRADYQAKLDELN